MEEKKRFESLQCLRAVAAILVLWAHIKFALYHSALSKTDFIHSAAGAVGVDVFFVISGFVIALTAAKINNNWKLFLLHRIVRVAPFYWIITCCFFILTSTIGIQNLTESQIFNTFLFLPVLDLGQFRGPIHPYGWTLCFEMWFYIAFATLLVACKEQAKKVLVLIMLGSTILVSILYKGAWVLPHFIFSPLVLEFCGGILLYSFYDKLVKKKVAIIAAVLCISSFIGVVLTENLGWYNRVLDSVWLGWERFFIWGTFAVTLILTFLYLEKRNPTIFPSWLRKLGDASYSLYLVQPIIIFYAHRISYYYNSLLGGAFFILGTIFSAIILHKIIEKPLTGFIRRKTEKLFSKK
jgi:exopolysaccharide production protein ExoZ